MFLLQLLLYKYELRCYASPDALCYYSTIHFPLLHYHFYQQRPNTSFKFAPHTHSQKPPPPPSSLLTVYNLRINFQQPTFSRLCWIYACRLCRHFHIFTTLLGSFTHPSGNTLLFLIHTKPDHTFTIPAYYTRAISKKKLCVGTQCTHTIIITGYQKAGFDSLVKMMVWHGIGVCLYIISPFL